MTKRVIACLILACVLLYYFAIRPGLDQWPVGTVVPDFLLQDRSGTSIQLSSLRGKVVLVNFWASNCYPCVEEIPSLNRLYARFQGQPFEILAISEDGDAPEAWRHIDRFSTRLSMTFPILLDEYARVADLYGTYVLPESYLIDHEGKLIRKFIGAMAWDDEVMLEEIGQWVQAIREGA